MILARIVGTVVSTRKDARLEGKKLLIVKPVNPEGGDESGYLIAVDTVDSGFRETVLVVTGSSARMAAECKDRPVDAAIVGIVDTCTSGCAARRGVGGCAQEIIGLSVVHARNEAKEFPDAAGPSDRKRGGDYEE